MMYLLDTHVILWALDNQDRLSINAEEVISNLDKTCYISVISLFEIAIKKKIGKLELTRSIKDYVLEIQRIGIILLPIRNEYLYNYDVIPILPDHRDPFDRLLIATAYSENLSIISADEKFYLYNDFVSVIW